MADIDAETDPTVVVLNGVPDVGRRGKAAVAGPVVVDCQADVELLHHAVQYPQRIGMWAADDGRQPNVTSVFECASDVRFVVFHRHIAAAQRGDSGVAELGGYRAPLLP